jgi:hypothetical protein
MSAYTHFRDTAEWRPKAGESEIAGVENLGAAQTIPVADWGTNLTKRGGDTVQRHVYWALPEHAVKPDDHLNGKPVREVDDVKDIAGNLQYWICYAEI